MYICMYVYSIYFNLMSIKIVLLGVCVIFDLVELTA